MKLTYTVATLLVVSSATAAEEIMVEAEVKLTGLPGVGSMQLWGTYSPTRIASGFTGQMTRIIDLEKRTITNLYLSQKSYQVESFDQFAERMSQSAQLRQSLAAQGALYSLDAAQKFDIKQGTAVATIAGIEARQMLFSSESTIASQKGEMWVGAAPEGFEAARALAQEFRERLVKENAWPDDWFNHLESQIAVLGLSLRKTPAELAEVLNSRVVLKHVSTETKKAAEISAGMRAAYGKQYEKIQAEMNKRAAAEGPKQTTIEIASLRISKKPASTSASDIPAGFTEFRMPEASAVDKKKMEEMMKAREKAMREMNKK